MTFHPEAFLQSAAVLVKQSSLQEAHCRTVIGRAYYAAYGTLRARLCQGKGMPAARLFAKRGRHGELVGLLALSGGQFKSIQMQYRKLYQGRVLSDYDYARSIARADAEEAYEDAQWVVAKLMNITDRDFRGFPLAP